MVQSDTNILIPLGLDKAAPSHIDYHTASRSFIMADYL